MTAAEEFDLFYEQGSSRLALQLMAFTGDPSEAGDLVQEAYVRAWTRWGRVSRLDDPQAWVRRVAYNLAKNQARRRRRQSLFAMTTVAVDEDPSERRRLELASAMATLSPEHRQAIVLHYLGGLTLPEIATEMGVPVGTVKSWLSRARTYLASALADLDAKEDGEGDDSSRGQRRS